MILNPPYKNQRISVVAFEIFSAASTCRMPSWPFLGGDCHCLICVGQHICNMDLLFQVLCLLQAQCCFVFLRLLLHICWMSTWLELRNTCCTGTAAVLCMCLVKQHLHLPHNRHWARHNAKVHAEGLPALLMCPYDGASGINNASIRGTKNVFDTIWVGGN